MVMETVGSNDGLDGTRPGPVGSLDGAGRCWPGTRRLVPRHGPGRGRRVAATNSARCWSSNSTGRGRRVAVLASERGRGASTSGHESPLPLLPPTPGHELDGAVLVVELDGAVPRPRMEIDARLPRIAYNATNPVRRSKSLLAGFGCVVRAFSAIPEPLAVPTATRHPAASVPVAVPVAVLAASARARLRSG
jgi:hypothetical protein